MTPAVRYNFLLFHRINGYIIYLLVFISNIGALMIVRRSFGGHISTQSAVGVLVLLTSGGIGMGYINIKRLQIDQHRAWMLRTMFYLGTIITTRIVLVLSALITSMIKSYFVPMSCGEIEYLALKSMTRVSLLQYLQQNYPACLIDPSNTTTISTVTIFSDNMVAVNANMLSGEVAGLAAAFQFSFGSALWMAIFLHLVGVEIYLALTPRESHRLREVAYQKQLEAGMKNPGSSGLVPERFGDADEWHPSHIERRKSPISRDSDEAQVGNL